MYKRVTTSVDSPATFESDIWSLACTVRLNYRPPDQSDTEFDSTAVRGSLWVTSLPLGVTERCTAAENGKPVR